MRHFFFTINHRRATALLVSLILMSILLVLAVGFNAVIIRQIRTERHIINAGKAFYAAEAGIERALFELDKALPGYEKVQPPKTLGASDYAVTSGYRITGQNVSVPCNYKALGSFDQEDLIWNRLQYNQTARIPLYKEKNDGSGEKLDLKDFSVFFYLDNGSSLLGIGPVLRWKVIGQSIDPATEFRTESINDLYPEVANNTFLVDSDGDGTLDVSATGFGTNLTFSSGYFSNAHSYSEDINTNTYYYTDYSIQQFLSNHNNNTLVMTNVIDLTQQPAGLQSPEDNAIMYRVASEDTDSDAQADPEELVVCDVALLSGDGFADSGKVKQSLDVSIRLDSFLPVFDYALYRTKR